MKRARLLLGIGIWVALLPHFGLPLLIKNILFLLTGLVLVYLALVIYKQIRQSQKTEKSFDNFTENNQENHDENNEENETE